MEFKDHIKQSLAREDPEDVKIGYKLWKGKCKNLECAKDFREALEEFMRENNIKIDPK